MKKIIFSILAIVVVVIGVVMISRNGEPTEVISPSPSISSSSEVSSSPSSSATNSVSGSPTVSPSTSTMPSTSVSATPSSAKKMITLAQIAAHASAQSCWSTIEDKVYDLTSWIAQHPGGEEGILKICGKDGTSLFVGQHDHNAKQQNILTTFYIGDLAK